MSDEKNLNEEMEQETVEEAAEVVEAEAETEAVEETVEVAETVEEPEQAEVAETVGETVNEAAEVVEEEAEPEAEVAEETAEAVEEAEAVAEEVAEDTVAEAVEAVEETVEAIEDKAEAVAAEAFEAAAPVVGDTAKKMTNKSVIITAAAAAAAVAVVVAIVLIMLFVNRNPYEKYIDVTGRTIGQVAEEANIDYEQFLEIYDLPEDMPKNTSESSAYNTIPFATIIEMNQFTGMETVEDAKKMLELPDEIDDDTPWGVAIGEAPLRAYVGESNVDSFKERYGLGDDVTGDTKYKDVRKTVDNADKRAREERERQTAQSEN